MKMRFWQKTYVFTLILFLTCLNIGILSLTMYTHKTNIKNAEESAKSSQNYVAISFERDFEYLDEGKSVELLMESYGNHYKNDAFLCFMENGEVLYTSFPSDCIIPENSIKHMELWADQRHIVISSHICQGKYTLIYAKNYGYLDDEFKSLMTIYLLTSICVSLILALFLYIVLKKLSVPLERLKETTVSIEKGDFSVRAEVKGDDEYAILAGSFNSMLEKINEQIETLELDARNKQLLVDNMAHELRTPLTSIYGYAEILEKASIPEEKRIVAAKYIMSESERLQKISEILLDGAFIRENTVAMDETDLSKIINDVCEKLKLKADNSEVSVTSTISSMIIKGNETLLSMLFYNLLENGIKACSKGGKVEIYRENNVVIIKDNGKGISEKHLLKITEPFFRTDKSRSRADGGAGLGLSLCKQIAFSHGLELVFESELNVGTKVKIDFTSLKQL